MKKKRLKVLQVLGSLYVGGAESRMMDVYRHINREKISFDFLVFRKEHQPYEDEIYTYGGKIFKLDPLSFKNIPFVINSVRKVLREEKYNAVHAHTSYFSGVIMMAAWLEHIPVRITHARTTDSVRSRLPYKVVISIGKRMINRFATNRIAISKNAGDYLFGSLPYEVIPNAIDIEKYQTIDDSKVNVLRQLYGIPDSSFVIGQIGRFNPMKNHEFTIEWFYEYLKDNEDSVLILVGDGYLRANIEKKVNDLGIGERVRFTGVVNNINEVIHLFDVLLFPSIYEGLGGVVLEAQAAGVPVVISDVLPDETDMGLGLITRCSLDAGYDKWTNAVNQCRKRNEISYDDINLAFKKHKYSIEYELERLYSIYNGKP